MRISADNMSRHYVPDGHLYTIYLDGKEVDNAVEADDEKGEVIVYCDLGDRWVGPSFPTRKKIFGEVKIVKKKSMDIEKRKAEIHKKGWGQEIWISNNDEYCGKILEFGAGKTFSMHYHLLKREDFYVLEGRLKLEYFDLSNADRKSMELLPGDAIEIKRGVPHKITALEKSRIIEISTTHHESDSYRVEKGDSQK